MAVTAVDGYGRIFRYERECVALVVASLESVPIEHRSDALYQKALTLVGHMRAALQVWLARLGMGQMPTHPFPSAESLDREAEAWRAAIEQWSNYLATCQDADLERPIQYRTTTGAAYENTLGDILQHLFGHALYHRGQIALLVRQLGGTPAVTDFIVWARQQG